MFKLFALFIAFSFVAFSMDSEQIAQIKANISSETWNRKILVIIDMEPCFPAALDIELQKRIIFALQEAMEQKSLIILIEYKNWDHTLPAIADIVKDYPGKITLHKQAQSGCPEIESLLDLLAKQTPNIELYLCGVDTAACVQATALELCDSMQLDKHHVFVLSNCCGSATEEQHLEAIEELRVASEFLKNLSVL